MKKFVRFEILRSLTKTMSISTFEYMLTVNLQIRKFCNISLKLFFVKGTDNNENQSVEGKDGCTQRHQVYSYICPFTHPLIHPLIHPFIHLFILTFIIIYHFYVYLNLPDYWRNYKWFYIFDSQLQKSYFWFLISTIFSLKMWFLYNNKVT